MSATKERMENLQKHVRRLRRWNIPFGVIVVGSLMAAKGIQVVPEVIQTKTFEVGNDSDQDVDNDGIADRCDSDSPVKISDSEVKPLVIEGAGGNSFVYSVSLSGERMVVGASSIYFGSACIYERNETGAWEEIQKLTPSDGADTTTRFGLSVSLSGDRVVVGAWNPIIGGRRWKNEPGSAYVYELNASTGIWEEIQILTASDGVSTKEYDWFGYDVALSGDRIVVGAPASDVGRNETQGRAHVFELNPSTGVWEKTQSLTASDGEAADAFGHSVSISGDAVVVGAIYANVGDNTAQGSAYVYTFAGSTGVWKEIQKLTSSNGGALDSFGSSVSISGARIVVRARYQHIRGSEGVKFQQGSAYVYALNASDVWEEIQTLTPSNGNEKDVLGRSVSVSSDRVVVGAVEGTKRYQGRVYVYTLGRTDCDGNGVVDSCEIADGSGDCNSNGLIDAREILEGTATDSDGDGLLDVCEPGGDLDLK